MEAEAFSLKRTDVKNESFPFDRKDFRLYHRIKDHSYLAKEAEGKPWKETF